EKAQIDLRVRSRVDFTGRRSRWGELAGHAPIARADICCGVRESALRLTARFERPHMLKWVWKSASPGFPKRLFPRPNRSRPRALAMGILALFVAGFHPEMASCVEWCFDPICARFEGTDLIRILIPGRFEITVTKNEGFGAEIYDLQ